VLPTALSDPLGATFAKLTNARYMQGIVNFTNHKKIPPMNHKNYQAVDYFNIDELLGDDHKIIRSSIRDWVNRRVKPIIEKAALEHRFPHGLMREMGDLGALGPYIPEQYGGAGLDQMAYGLIMTELERGDSAVRSAASVQSSLVMYPIYTFGSEEQRKKTCPNWQAANWLAALASPNRAMAAILVVCLAVFRTKATITCSMGQKCGLQMHP
jgi:hypothetical protein